MKLATVMARDEQTDLAVLQMDSARGAPASGRGPGVPSAGEPLRLVQAGRDTNTACRCPPPSRTAAASGS